MPGLCTRRIRNQAKPRLEKQRPTGRCASSCQQPNEVGLAGRLAAQPDAGVLVVAVHAHLEMEVRSGRPTSGTFVRDQVASRHDLTALEAARISGRVPVVRRVTVAVDHDDKVAVADRSGVKVDDAGVSSHDRRAVWPGDVDTGVNAMRVRTGVIRYLHPERHAAEALTYA